MINTVPLAEVPQNVFVSPDGNLLWITSQLASRITVLDSLTFSPVSFIANIGLPAGIGFNPTGTIAYVASATIPGAIQAVNAQDYSLGPSYAVGNEPVDVRVTGRYVAVMNRTSGFISQINLQTGKVTSDPGRLTNVSHTGLTLIQ